MSPPRTPGAGRTTHEAGEVRACFARLLNGYSLRVVRDRAWVQGVRLEMLAAVEFDPPCAYIWVPKKTNLDFTPRGSLFTRRRKNCSPRKS
jgi:hypothetical protein